MSFADLNESRIPAPEGQKTGALVNLLIKFGIARKTSEAYKVLLIAAICIAITAVIVFFIGKPEPEATPLPYEATYENAF